MIPIFEQGQGKGIGYSFNAFLSRFVDICGEHLRNKTAKSFAFIIYDFNDELFKTVLKDQGGFTKLDRLSGTDLSVFYIHSESRNIVNAFNDIFFEVFGIDIKFPKPFVLFFNVIDREVTNIEIFEIEQSNILFAFEELYSIIGNYISRAKDKTVKKIKPSTNKLTEFFKSVNKIALDKFIKYLLDKVTEYASLNIF